MTTDIEELRRMTAATDREAQLARERLAAAEKENFYQRLRRRMDSGDLMQIGEFCPSGTQIKSPGGLCLRPRDVVAVECRGGELIIHFPHSRVAVQFHYWTDGSPALVYAIASHIRGYRWPEDTPF